MRRLLAIRIMAVAVTAAAAVACAPQETPSGRPAPTSRPTRPAGSTTQPAEPSSCPAKSSAVPAKLPDGVTWPPVVLNGRDAVVAEATAAVARATAAGKEQITVIALDSASRPVFVPATTANAVDVATLTDASMDVVAVEPDVESRPSMPPSSTAATTETDATTEMDATTTTTAGALSVSTDPMVADQWAHKAYPFSELWRCGRGAGVKVAVVDTGVDATHPDFDGRVTAGVAFDDGGPRLGQGGVDPNGHGTHIAGIIANTQIGSDGEWDGVAPGARRVGVRVLDAKGSGT